mmetsp:Transcript_9439/g.17491  ORF Transcript_9439/g.17491 Transcript_9439/m.17491 type:complete len:290 (-) Transcript_9439:75-944(-)
MTNAAAIVAALLVHGAAALCDEECPEMVSLLQTSSPRVAPQKNLAMVYVPFNFGHTVSEKAASLGIYWGDCGSREPVEGCLGYMKSDVTGCDLMYTPGKLWPAELAKVYFGNRTTFGILRDPFERMVAQFRGTYRLKHPELGCDLNRGIKMMMQEYLAAVGSGNPFTENCNYLPQAEFFDDPFGAHEAVDNRLFPKSANELFSSHGLPLQIATEEISHVEGCEDKWAGDLDNEAKGMIRKVYQRDFDLICQRFGYCDLDEATCLQGVPTMCPEALFEWDERAKMYVPRS